MAIRALTFDNASNIESRNDAYWYNFITKSICQATVGIIKNGSSMEPEQNDNVIIFDHGYVIIYGRLIEVDQGTELIIPLPDLNQTVSGHVIIRVNLQNEPGNQVFLTTTTDPLIQEDLNAKLLGIYDYVIGSYTADHNNVKYTDKRNYINSNYIENKLSDTISKLNTIKSDLETARSNLNNRINNINNNYGIENNNWTKIESNSGEFDKKATGKWYMLMYNESHDSEYTMPKFIFFRWIFGGVSFLIKIEERIRDNTHGYLKIESNKGLFMKTIYFPTHNTSEKLWKNGELNSWIICIYRWDGEGLPVTAGREIKWRKEFLED